jgi:cytochrome b561
MRMALKSARDRYGVVAVSIHWVSAMLIVILIGSGFRAAHTVDLAAKAAILRLHVPVAIGVLALTVFRIVWWFLFDRKPTPIAGSPIWQERAARAVHILFYVAILTLGASGIGMLALSGAAPIIFGGDAAGAALLPDFSRYPPRVVHGIGARLLLALLALHAGAALYHHFVRRDGLLWRMWWFSERPSAGVPGRGAQGGLRNAYTAPPKAR